MSYSIKSGKKKVHSAKWDSCVEKVKEKDSSVNPYAVCTSTLGEKSFEPKKKRLTIYDIKYQSQEKAPHFFDSKTLKFFGQRMSSFSVKKIDDTHYQISAPMVDRSTGRYMGQTKRIFNTETKELEFVE